jgi:DNA-directed RNA polymerase subunit M/transcription elongation factor TFIIS
MIFGNGEQLSRVWDLETFNIYKQKEQEFEKYTLSPHDVVEGVLVCHKCKSKKICAFSRQIRSGDEPMSVFAKCTMCQHCWVQ